MPLPKYEKYDWGACKELDLQFGLCKGHGMPLSDWEGVHWCSWGKRAVAVVRPFSETPITSPSGRVLFTLNAAGFVILELRTGRVFHPTLLKKADAS